MPRDFITDDGFGITEKCRRYLLPLIQGEDYPAYRDGLPVYATLKNVAVAKKLAAVRAALRASGLRAPAALKSRLARGPSFGVQRRRSSVGRAAHS